MNDIREEFPYAALDRQLRTQPRRDRANVNPARNRIDDRDAESASMPCPYHEHDLVLSGLEAREFSGIAFGAREAAGENHVHDAHRLCNYYPGRVRL